MEPPTVAIAGATGRIGIHVVHAFLSRPHTFSHLTLFARTDSTLTPDSPLSAILAQYPTSTTSRTTVRPLDPSKLDGIKVLICCLPSSAQALRQDLARGLANSGVKLYLPSEFGVDHSMPVPEFEHPEWIKKREHLDLVREVAPEVTVCRVFVGLLLEESVGPWFGFWTNDDRYSAIGSAEARASYTSLGDVGRAVVGLVSFSEVRGLQAVPGQVRVAGDTRSMLEIADIMQRQFSHSGQGQGIKVERSTPDASNLLLERIELLKKGVGAEDPSVFLRIIMGQGRADLTDGKSRKARDNELVTAIEKWEWKTMEDLAKETDGRPWRDSTWKPEKESPG